ncbi:MAG: hypothetical protein U5N21_10690 [Rhodococcus sp. (in: high G+C Gram-positive bacteria)]|uniref:hypothetical protein n=1 Tax=Rhodococcus sp. TaxID=1831 RepID=UPI002AD95657|nr:hypothetical protein [Rhodococcus sp. (in: high G+C Gram-positive bacteria)]MDZ7930483.1 hypothetical protein [Rhodococcus sp. (in: high G+C Gram-positive bacteria)]
MMQSLHGRLADEDATYWFLRQAFGWSVVLQLVWVTDAPVPKAVLNEVNSALTNGVLHRRLVTPVIPGARPRWVRATGAPLCRFDDDALENSDIDRWAADELASVELDAVEGTCWRLRATSRAGAGTVISLCALHLVADGKTMVTAAAAAMVDSVPNALLPNIIEAITPRSDPGTASAIIGDTIDATGRVLAAGRGALRAVRDVVADRAGFGGAEPAEISTVPARPARAPMADRSPKAVSAWATVTVPSDDWDRVAARHGGTANVLFVAVITGLLRSSGYAPLGDTVKVGIPVDRRGGIDDDRANATAGVSVMLTDQPVPGGDLRSVRAACKAAYQRLESGHRSAVAHLYPLAWLLPPSWLVGVATSGNGMPDAMVSNLGEVPSAAMCWGDVHATRLAFRGNAQGVDAAQPYRFGDGAQAWALRTDNAFTFSVLAFDESSFGDTSTLRELVAAELAAWQLPNEIW